MLLGGLFNLTTGTRPASDAGRREPGTPVQGVRTPSGASNVVPFVIPGTSAEDTQLNFFEPASSKIIKTPRSIQNRMSGSSGCSDTITPPGSPHVIAPEHPNRVTNEEFNYYPGAVGKKEKRTTSSFSHARCMNCNSQFIVNISSSPRNPTRSISGEFCSGECRCSFLASGIDQQYCTNETSQTFMMSNSSGDDMDSSDDEW